MSGRCFVALPITVAVVLLATGVVSGQTLTTKAESGASSRTPWGDPDLQGTWTNTTTTPLQRPDEFGGRSVLTNEERAELDAQATGSRERPPTADRSAEWRRRDAQGAYNSFWVDRGTRSTQTSLIVDPVNGRLPALTERVRERDAAWLRTRSAVPPLPDSWEDLNLYDRCITRGLPGAMIPGFYNHNYQILQTSDYVVILVEMIHDARIIPLDGRPHLSPQLHQWLGDSRAHWEGDTLVVETTNFDSKGDQRVRNLVLSGSEYSHVIERFTRLDAETLDYRVTVTDPTTYTRPWTASIPMLNLDAPIFEYACHEGNYGMENILHGARAKEKVPPPVASR